MIGMIVEIIVILFESACGFIFFQYFVDNDKKRTRLQTGAGVLLLTVLFLVDMLVWPNAKDFLWKELCNCILMSFLMKWYNGKPLVKNIVLTIIYLSVGASVDFVVVMFFSSIISYVTLPFDANLDYTTEISETITLFMSNLVFFLTIRLIGRIVDKKVIKYLDTSQWVRFTYFPIFIICVIGMMMRKLTYVIRGGKHVRYLLGDGSRCGYYEYRGIVSFESCGPAGNEDAE